MAQFSDDLKTFVDSSAWKYAWMYHSTWPHWYIVRKNVDEGMFVKTVEFIRANGYEGRFYAQKNIYFDDDKYSYWTMGNSIEKTEVINRCLKEDTYEKRLTAGTLPK